MRHVLVSSALTAVFAVAITTLPIDDANAKFRQIGSNSTAALRSKCAAAGGTFGTGAGGEHWCEKGENLVDCNGKNRCIGGTPRRGGKTPVTGGPTATGTAPAHPPSMTRASWQAASPTAGLAQRTGAHHR